MLDQRSEQELTGGGDTRLHYHLEDHQTNASLQQLARQNSVTTTPYAVTASDDFLLVDTSTAPAVVTLPQARNGKEYEIVKMTSDPNTVTIVPASPDTVLGSASGVIISNQYDALRVKAVSGGWIAI